MGGCGREKSPNEVRNDVMLLYALALLFSSSSSVLSSHFLFSRLLWLLLALMGPISINPCYFLMHVSACNAIHVPSAPQAATLHYTSVKAAVIGKAQ